MEEEEEEAEKKSEGKEEQSQKLDRSHTVRMPICCKQSGTGHYSLVLTRY